MRSPRPRHIRKSGTSGRRTVAISPNNPQSSPKTAALADVVSGKTPAIFNAYRADDIDTAIRLGTEFHLKYMLASVAEGYLIRDKIKQAGVPCLVGAVMQPFESLETVERHL